MTQLAENGVDLDLVVRYEDEMLAELSPQTIRDREGPILRFARWLQPASLLEVSTRDIVGWNDGLGGSAAVRAGRLRALHRFYSWCLNEELIERDPTAPLIHVRQPVLAGDLPSLTRRFVNAQERRSLSPITIRKRACDLRLFYDFLAPKSILDATPKDIDRFLDSRGRAGKPLEAGSRRALLVSLSVFYRWARREGLVTENPVDDIDKPLRKEAVPRPISDVDLALALDRADMTVKAILSLAAFCGLRAREVAGLCREDILDQLDQPMLIVSQPKGRRQRTVPLHPVAWASIELMLPRSGPVFVQRDNPAQPAEWAAKRVGGPWLPWKVSHVANEHLHSLGIASTLHSLRHWYATSVYGLSLDLRLVQELLGHTDPRTTSIYTAFSNPKAASVVGQLARPEKLLLVKGDAPGA